MTGSIIHQVKNFGSHLGLLFLSLEGTSALFLSSRMHWLSLVALSNLSSCLHSMLTTLVQVFVIPTRFPGFELLRSIHPLLEWSSSIPPILKRCLVTWRINFLLLCGVYGPSWIWPLPISPTSYSPAHSLSPYFSHECFQVSWMACVPSNLQWIWSLWSRIDFQGWITDPKWPQLNMIVERQHGDYGLDVDFDLVIYLCERISKLNRN